MSDITKKTNSVTKAINLQDLKILKKVGLFLKHLHFEMQLIDMI